MNILLVEDNEDDAFFVERAFHALGRTPPIHTCATVRDAMAYLTRSEPFRDAERFPLPTLIITDLQLPESSGFDLIRLMREHGWREMPVTVLSSSAEESDVRQAYRAGANAYFVKPGEFKQLVSQVQRILDFWDGAVVPKAGPA